MVYIEHCATLPACDQFPTFWKNAPNTKSFKNLLDNYKEISELLLQFDE